MSPSPDCMQILRHISLPDIIVKLMEKMFNMGLNWYVQYIKFACDGQTEFRRNQQGSLYSSARQSVIFYIICKSTVTSVDFKSAHDSFWGKFLINKLCIIGINSNILYWFRAFIGRRSCTFYY